MGESIAIPELEKNAQFSGTRDVILQASLTLFVTQGYANTKIAQIAERSGIAKGSVYLHFRSKKDLAIEVYRMCAERAVLGLEESLCSQETLVGKLRTLIAHMFQWVETDREAATYLLLVRHSEIFPDDAPEADMASSPGLILERILREGMASREIPVTDLQIALCSAGIPILLVRMKLEGWYQGALAVQVDRITRMCCAALGIAPE